jgi:hypothetical protein
MKKLAGFALLMAATAVCALAQTNGLPTDRVPEISAAACVNALTLLSGASLLIRSRRKK